MPLPDKVAQQLYDQLNEMEAQMGSPMPPQVRASIHDDLEQHYARMLSVQRSARWFAVAGCASYLVFVAGLSLTLAGQAVVGPTLAAGAFGAVVSIAQRLGQLRERHDMMKNVGVELHRITYDE